MPSPRPYDAGGAVPEPMLMPVRDPEPEPEPDFEPEEPYEPDGPYDPYEAVEPYGAHDSDGEGAPASLAADPGPLAPAGRFEPEPFDDIPMSDTDYEAAAWPYGQATATQSLDAHPGGPVRERAPQPEQQAEYRADQQEHSGFTMEMPRVESEATRKAKDFRVASARPHRGAARLALFIAAGVAVGAIVAAVVTFALGIWGGVSVPDVTGMTESDARAALTDEGFSVRTTQVKSDDTEGLVLIMDPGAGSRAPEGSEVVIHIATARFVPDIVGKNQDEAKAMLDAAGYENVRYEMQKSDGDENKVLEVSPEEGTRAKSNAEIVVKVSEAYRVPSVEGLDASAAADAVSDAGLTPEVVYIDTDQFSDGTIIGTNPEAGAKVSEGAYVSISVARARGVELVGLTEQMFSQGNTVTVGGVDYEIESLISVSYQGDETVAFTANGRPKITFFGETLYASSSQTITGQVEWSEDDEVIAIY